jgi:hypothetical protein
MNYQRLVIGYHGCDAAVVTKVLSGEETLTPSERDYDWLGKGIYFWEFGPQRAYDWAKAEARRAPDKIQSPGVLGALVNLGHCFDLLDTSNTRLLQQLYLEFIPRRNAGLSGQRDHVEVAHPDRGQGPTLHRRILPSKSKQLHG